MSINTIQEVAAQNEIKLKPLTLQIVDKLQPMVTIGEDGTPNLPNNSFESVLPEGTTLEDVKNVQAIQVSFEAAANLVLGNAFVDAALQDPNIQQATAKLAVGNDTYRVNIARSAHVSAGVGADAGRREVYANVTSGIRTPNSEVKRASQIVRALGEQLRVAQG